MLKRRKFANVSTKESPHIRSASHLKWLRGWECAVSNDDCAGKMEAAHVRLGNHAGMGQKPGDDQAIPLCSHHHAEQHATGEKTFQTKYKLDAIGLAAKLWLMSPTGIEWRAAEKRT